MLTTAEGLRLLEIAREAISYGVSEGGPDDSPIDPKTRDFGKNLLAPCGAFVTLKAGEHLRGCIGLIEAAKPLWETVREMALAAALEDPRFMPITAEELPGLHLEISALSPLEEVSSLKRIVVGEHGLLVRKGFHSGLLLPQVAAEHGWGMEEFLRNTCYKAGLHPDTWKRRKKDPEIKIFIFSAQLFDAPFQE